MGWKRASILALGLLLIGTWLEGQMRIDGAVPTLLDITTLRFDRANKDVSLSRGAANRLDLASGDSLNLVSGGLGVGVVDTTVGLVHASVALVVGTTPATAGSERFPNDGTIQFRNQADTANLTAVTVGTDNILLLGSNTGSGVTVGAANGTVEVNIYGPVGFGGSPGTTDRAPQWVDPGTKPACDANHRGMVWYDAGAAAVLDTFELCRKDAADAYAWVTLF